MSGSTVTKLPPSVPSVSESPAVTVDEDTYDEAVRLHRGWCPSCEEFNAEGVDAKAKGLSCRDCFDDRVCGAAHAKRAGFIEVVS